MLMLSRKAGERVVIYDRDGGSIAVVVQEFRGREVRLGFDGDPDRFRVVREEVDKGQKAGGGAP